jgi:hypothetical protein
MGTRRKETAKPTLPKIDANMIILWLVYLAIGFMVAFIFHNNIGLGLLESCALGAGASLLIVVAAEVLDRKLGWTKATNEAEETTADISPKPKPEARHRNKKVVLTATEYIEANEGMGSRALIRGFVEQGGNADDIRAELNK